MSGIAYDFMLQRMRTGSGSGSNSAGGGPYPARPIFFDDPDYPSSCGLDTGVSMGFLGYQAFGWTKIQLWIVSADDAATGNAVLKVGTHRFVVAVGAAPSLVELTFAVPVTGVITVTRDTADEDDNLNAAARVIDSRCY